MNGDKLLFSNAQYTGQSIINLTHRKISATFLKTCDKVLIIITLFKLEHVYVYIHKILIIIIIVFK